MLQLCAHSAAGRIVIVEPEESKRELAMKMGASLFINPTKEDPKEAIARAGIRVDKVMECGGIPATIETALDIAGRGATVVLFGVAAPEARVAFKPYEAFTKELVIKTSYINPGTTRRAIDLLACGTIDTKLAISKQLELEDLPEEMATRKYSHLGKVLVRVDKNTKD
jgi:threonine dehydrogenase-like Zn-dependent dehydrogenase